MFLLFSLPTSYVTFIDAGMVGDYSKARVLVLNASSGIVTGLQYANNQYLSYNPLPIVNVTQGININIVLAWSTRLLVVEVLPHNSSAR